MEKARKKFIFGMQISSTNKNPLVKYHLNDMTRSNYEQLLIHAKKNYQFCNYKNFRKYQKFILWRHDIDVSAKHARELAEIEAKHKVKATYYVLLHSELYNLLDKHDYGDIKKIIKLGHEIGLHFETGFYDVKSEKQLVKYLAAEKKFLEEIFGVKIYTFSFHNPDKHSLKFDKPSYAGMINTYSKFFRSRVNYCSDSNGYWRHKRIKQVLCNEKHERLQVLTHPIFWQKKAGFPKNKIWNWTFEEADRKLISYDKLLKKCGRKNIGELDDSFRKLDKLDKTISFRIQKYFISEQ